MKSATTIAISVAAISGTFATSSPQHKRTRQNNLVPSGEVYEWGRSLVGSPHSDVNAEEQQHIEKNVRMLEGSMSMPDIVDTVDDIDNPPLDLSNTPVPFGAADGVTIPTYAPTAPWPTYAPTAGDGTDAPSVKEEEVVATTTMATTVAEGTAVPTPKITAPLPTYNPTAAETEEEPLDLPKATAGDYNAASACEVVVATLLLGAVGVWANMN